MLLRCSRARPTRSPPYTDIQLPQRTFSSVGRARGQKGEAPWLDDPIQAMIRQSTEFNPAVSQWMNECPSELNPGERSGHTNRNSARSHERIHHPVQPIHFCSSFSVHSSLCNSSSCTARGHGSGFVVSTSISVLGLEAVPSEAPLPPPPLPPRPSGRCASGSCSAASSCMSPLGMGSGLVRKPVGWRERGHWRCDAISGRARARRRGN